MSYLLCWSFIKGETNLHEVCVSHKNAWCTLDALVCIKLQYSVSVVTTVGEHTILGKDLSSMHVSLHVESTLWDKKHLPCTRCNDTMSVIWSLMYWKSLNSPYLLSNLVAHYKVCYLVFLAVRWFSPSLLRLLPSLRIWVLNYHWQRLKSLAVMV